jgi:hypothetical protein
VPAWKNLPRLGAPGQRPVLRDILLDVERAEQHVDRIADLGRQPQFLREGVEPDVGRIGIDQIGAGEVRILRGDRVAFAIGGDRGQRRTAEIIIDLAREAPVLDVVLGREVVVDLIAELPADGVHVPAQADDRLGGGRPGQIDHAAAHFVLLVVIADHADLEVGAGLEQRLGANEPAVALVGFAAGAEILDIAVTRGIAGTQAERHRLGNRAGDIALGDDRVVVAIAGLDRAAGGELRFLGDHRNDARRRVLAEQGRLRAAQHLDPLHCRQVVDPRRGARAVDAVDEHADRRLDPRIVGPVAEAADNEIGIGRALQLGDLQRGDHHLEVLDIADFRALDRLARGH